MRGARFVICHEPAAPPLIACSTVVRETPALAASTSASHTAMFVPATATWLHSLVICPAPCSPQYVIVLPNDSNNGRHLSNTSLGPPTMIDSVAFTAPP